MSGACSIGQILLQPERMDRVAADDGEEALLDDILAAAARVVSDRALGGTMVDDFIAALEAIGPRLVERAGTGFQRAIDHASDLAGAIPGAIESLTAIFDNDDAAEVAEGLLGLLESLAKTTGDLSIDGLRDGVTKVLSVLEEDLGLTREALEEEGGAIADALVARLAITKAGSDPAVAANRAAVADTLRRLLRRFRGTLTLPALSADRIARAIFEELDKLLGPALEKLACVGHVSADALAATRAVGRAVPFTGFGSTSVGAAEIPPASQRTYLWYSTWLLGDADIDPWQLWRSQFFKAHVWIDETQPTHTMFRENRLVLRSDDSVGACRADATTWAGLVIPRGVARDAGGVLLDLLGALDAAPTAEIPVEEDHTYTFRLVSPESMDRLAYHSAWAADAMVVAQHVWSPFWNGTSARSLTIRKGGEASSIDISYLILELLHLVPELFPQPMPTSFAIAPNKAGKAVDLLALRLSTLLLGSLQGLHVKAPAQTGFWEWATVLAKADFSRALSPHSVPTLLRDALLSFVTLSNSEDPTPDGKDNRLQSFGLLNVVEFVVNFIYVRCVVDPRDYGRPILSVRVLVIYTLVGGTIAGIVTGVLGTLLIWGTIAITGANVASPTALRNDLIKSVVKSVALFRPPTWSTWMENATDGGRLNLRGRPFVGYADAEVSPYLLPWNAATAICGQGNLGSDSHNVWNPDGEQVYAYDFMLDRGEEILASRGGIVTDYFDWVPDDAPIPSFDEPPSEIVPRQTIADMWNFIVIRHHHDAHDRGEDGNWVTTYAVYGHGTHGSVREAFLERGIAPADIIGTRVLGGHPIMRAGSTGRDCSTNQVHMEVREGPWAADLKDPFAPIPRVELKDTIPFVFQDGGNPATNEWVASSNRRTPPT